MTKLTTFFSLIAVALIVNQAAAETRIISSAEQRTVLIELYTSEGCSSCPPAEHWLSGLKSDARLWKQFVPIAFHVDYWNYLGWRDRFAEARFSQRQSNYERHDYLRTVYTPGIMKNGREWRDWSYTDIPVSTPEDIAGVLKASFLEDNTIVEYTPTRRYHSPLILNIALLGFDLSSHVASGENAGKILRHDFVVLGFRQFRQAPHDGLFRWEPSGLLKDMEPQPSGIALWVTAADDPTPLQATGGWLR